MGGGGGPPKAGGGGGGGGGPAMPGIGGGGGPIIIIGGGGGIFPDGTASENGIGGRGCGAGAEFEFEEIALGYEGGGTYGGGSGVGRLLSIVISLFRFETVSSIAVNFCLNSV